MIKKEKLVMLVLVMFLLNIFIASATIELSQPLAKYNFGDAIYLTVTINPSVVSGSFNINVVCENKSANVYKIAPAEGAFSANNEQKLNHKIVLTKEFIGDLSGNCNIVVSLGGESVSSSSFTLSKDITLTITTNKQSYNPGEAVFWNLQAIKANELPLNGFVELSNNLTNGIFTVANGKAADSFEIPANASAGRYELIFFAYDKDSNGILNEKKYYSNYEVNQIPTRIDVSLLSLEATPGEEFQFGTDLFDQSGTQMPGTLLVTYTSPKNEKKQFNTESGTTAKINFSYNATPGKYSLIVSKDNIKTEKEFTLKAVPKLDIQFIEGSSVLIIKNIGNTIYKDNLDVTIGNQTTTISLDLALGEEKKFNLEAPNGVYNVKAQSGESIAESTIPLTGNAISIREGNGTIIFEASPLVWIFIVAILLLAGIIVFIRNKKRTFKFWERHANTKEAPTLEQVSKKAHMQKQFLDLAAPKVSEAESNLSMKGSKDLCSVICLNIKNKSTLGVEGNEKLNELLEQTQHTKGVVDFKSQHILIIYSPLLTRTFNNEIIAAKSAFEIKTKIDEYNKRFKDKIVYNIGVHAGEMINSLNNGKLSYTSLGNSIILAKRISDLSTEKMLVSGTFRQKLIRELKVEKITHALGNVDVFEVQRIADVEANAEKLRQLLKRTSFS